MAEGIYNANAVPRGLAQAESAGIFAVPGDPVTANAATAAAEYGADIVLRAAFPAGGAEQFSPRLTDLSAGALEMVAAGEEFLPGPREEIL